MIKWCSTCILLSFETEEIAFDKMCTFRCLLPTLLQSRIGVAVTNHCKEVFTNITTTPSLVEHHALVFVKIRACNSSDSKYHPYQILICLSGNELVRKSACVVLPVFEQL